MKEIIWHVFDVNVSLWFWYENIITGIYAHVHINIFTYNNICISRFMNFTFQNVLSLFFEYVKRGVKV